MKKMPEELLKETFFSRFNGILILYIPYVITNFGKGLELSNKCSATIFTYIICYCICKKFENKNKIKNKSKGENQY